MEAQQASQWHGHKVGSFSAFSNSSRVAAPSGTYRPLRGTRLKHALPLLACKLPKRPKPATGPILLWQSGHSALALHTRLEEVICLLLSRSAPFRESLVGVLSA